MTPFLKRRFPNLPFLKDSLSPSYEFLPRKCRRWVQLDPIIKQLIALRREQMQLSEEDLAILG